MKNEITKAITNYCHILSISYAVNPHITQLRGPIKVKQFLLLLLVLMSFNARDVGNTK